jgi:hypothetical protein
MPRVPIAKYFLTYFPESIFSVMGVVALVVVGASSFGCDVKGTMGNSYSIFKIKL